MKNANFFKRNADRSKIKVLVLKGIFSETTYVCISFAMFVLNFKFLAYS